MIDIPTEANPFVHGDVSVAAPVAIQEDEIAKYFDIDQDIANKDKVIGAITQLLVDEEFSKNLDLAYKIGGKVRITDKFDHPVLVAENRTSGSTFMLNIKPDNIAIPQTLVIDWKDNKSISLQRIIAHEVYHGGNPLRVVREELEKDFSKAANAYEDLIDHPDKEKSKKYMKYIKSAKELGEVQAQLDSFSFLESGNFNQELQISGKFVQYITSTKSIKSVDMMYNIDVSLDIDKYGVLPEKVLYTERTSFMYDERIRQNPGNQINLEYKYLKDRAEALSKNLEALEKKISSDLPEHVGLGFVNVDYFDNLQETASNYGYLEKMVKRSEGKLSILGKVEEEKDVESTNYIMARNYQEEYREDSFDSEVKGQKYYEERNPAGDNLESPHSRKSGKGRN